jgi:hypothetical protein
MQLVIDFYFLSISCKNTRIYRIFHNFKNFKVLILNTHLKHNFNSRNWRLYVRLGTPDDDRLTLETCRVIHIYIENKNLSQVASVGLLIGLDHDFTEYEHCDLENLKHGLFNFSISVSVHFAFIWSIGVMTRWILNLAIQNKVTNIVHDVNTRTIQLISEYIWIGDILNIMKLQKGYISYGV